MKWKIERSPLVKELELHKNPVIIRVNKFNEDSAKDFDAKIAAAHNTGQKIIPVVIDSYGGHVYSLLAMISSIKNSDLPVATIVEGKAMSCGALLFGFGTEGYRYVDRDATVMIHEVSSMQGGKVEEIKASFEETKRLNDKVFKMLARNIDKPEDYFLDKIHEKKHADWFLEAEECKDLGLANHIRVPSLNIKIDVNIDLI
jgi:ATP-dependent Clp endopeptidase proteolytic subunit ClpP